MKEHRSPRLLNLFLLFFLLLLIAGASVALLFLQPGGPFASQVNSPEAQIVREVIAAKLAAMEANDLEGYLALIDDSEPEYLIEQRNWFLNYQDAETSDYSIEVRRAQRVDENTIIAALRQHYRYGPLKEDRTVTYEAKFIRGPDGWKDADLNFEVLETEHFIIKYPEKVEGTARDVGEAAEVAYASVTEVLGVEAQSRTRIKLYTDKELLRETSDIRVAFLFSGWGEAGESIKMYAYGQGSGEGLIAHELVHKITLEITDSQTGWFAEGLACYFGGRPFDGGNPVELGWATAEELSQPVSWLEQRNLLEISDAQTRSRFYDMSAMVVEFMVETYGVEQVKAVLTELSKYPRMESGYSPAFEPEFQQRFYRVLETALGVSREEFNRQWLAWIRLQ